MPEPESGKARGARVEMTGLTAPPGGPDGVTEADDESSRASPRPPPLPLPSLPKPEVAREEGNTAGPSGRRSARRGSGDEAG